MTHGDHDQHSTTEISIDALHSHCNPIYKASSFVGEEPVPDEHRFNGS